MIDTPAIWFIFCPFSLVLHFSVGKIEYALAVHHVIFPLALIIAPILEDVLALAVLEPVFLLADVLVPVCVLLVDVLKLFVFGLLDDDRGGKNSIGRL